jgi:hypothetical protein
MTGNGLFLANHAVDLPFVAGMTKGPADQLRRPLLSPDRTSRSREAIEKA